MRAKDIGVVAIDTETTSLDPMKARLCGIALAVAPNEACYVPLGHRDGGAAGRQRPVCAGASFAPDQIPEKAALAALQPLLEDPGVLKIGQDLKYDWQILRPARHRDSSRYDDTMLMSYVLDAGRGKHDIDDLAERWLGHQPIRAEQIDRHRQSAGAVRPRRRSRRPANTPPRTPT